MPSGTTMNRLAVLGCSLDSSKHYRLWFRFCFAKSLLKPFVIRDLYPVKWRFCLGIKADSPQN
jgi:hypothetical protein